MVKKGSNELLLIQQLLSVACLCLGSVTINNISSLGYLSTMLCAVMKNYELQTEKVSKIFSPSNHTD